VQGKCPKYPRKLIFYRAHALIKNVDYTEALKMPGVIGVYDHKSVPGSNLWGDIMHDEEVFASKQVQNLYWSGVLRGY
jgi:xanthine dehydrogenase molybdopterin-binding subunit B